MVKHGCTGKYCKCRPGDRKCKSKSIARDLARRYGTRKRYTRTTYAPPAQSKLAAIPAAQKSTAILQRAKRTGWKKFTDWVRSSWHQIKEAAANFNEKWDGFWQKHYILNFLTNTLFDTFVPYGAEMRIAANIARKLVGGQDFTKVIMSEAGGYLMGKAISHYGGKVAGVVLNKAKKAGQEWMIGKINKHVMPIVTAAVRKKVPGIPDLEATPNMSQLGAKYWTKMTVKQPDFDADIAGWNEVNTSKSGNTFIGKGKYAKPDRIYVEPKEEYQGPYAQNMNQWFYDRSELPGYEPTLVGQTQRIGVLPKGPLTAPSPKIPQLKIPDVVPNKRFG